MNLIGGGERVTNDT